MTELRNGMRRGFTLIEVAVVLVLLSLLAAFVMPDVIKHIDDADPTRVEVDLRSIHNALDSWYVDNRRLMPGDLEDLIHEPDVGTDLGINSNSYTASDSLRWDGPYLRIALAASGASAADSVVTAFNGWIQNDLTLLDFTTSATSGIDETAGVCSAATWVSIKITGLATSEFERINDIIDGPDETDGTVSLTSGNLRRATGATGTTYYLAKPCRGTGS